MTSDLNVTLQTAIADLEKAGQMICAARAMQAHSSRVLKSLLEKVKEAGSLDVSPCTTPPTDHRKHHRAGPPPKIDVDPELQAFILARIDRLTFAQIANDVAKTFPPKRRVAKSAIHAWWTKNKANLAMLE